MAYSLLGNFVQDERGRNCERSTENVDWSLCQFGLVHNHTFKSKAVHRRMILFLSVDYCFLVGP